MNEDTLVKVENVSKKFCRTLKRSLLYCVQDVFGEITRRGQGQTPLRPGEFWAINDVSFELKRGECLGLIGPNGAGKSTILKLLNGLIKPDRGSITVSGRVGALIELGAGFNPILTGRENIYINGSVLGFSKREIDERIDEIINFAEISNFIDTPVQNYSSGMKVRLGFAVASQMNPDLLVIDEVLAVGDVGFRAKCYNRIAELMKHSAVILVTHSIPHVDRYCNRVLLMDKGQGVEDTFRDGKDKGEVIQAYYNLFSKEVGTVTVKEGNSLLGFKVLNPDGHETAQIVHGEELRVHIKAEVDPAFHSAVAHLAFHNRELQVVATCSSQVVSCDEGSLELSVNIAPFNLNPADYKISLIVFDEKKQHHLIWGNAMWDIKVAGELVNYGGAAICFNGSWSQQDHDAEGASNVSV